MTEVENVSFGSFSSIKDTGNPFFQFILRQKQSDRIKISLQGNIWPDNFDCIFNIYPPVKTKNIRTAGLALIKQGCTVVCKVNKRHTGRFQSIDDSLHVRQSKLAKIAGGKNTGP